MKRSKRNIVFNHDEGLTILEVLVATVIIAIILLIFVRIFSSAYRALEKARAKSVIESLIYADTENIRNALFNWKLNTCLYDQGLTYYGLRDGDPVTCDLDNNGSIEFDQTLNGVKVVDSPEDIADIGLICNTNDLAQQAITDLDLDASPTLDLSETTVNLKNTEVSKTVTVASGASQDATRDNNIIEVTYTTNTGAIVAIERVVYFDTPLQAFC